MKANKDKGTSVGFSTSYDCLKHEFIDFKYAYLDSDEQVNYKTESRCKKCFLPKSTLDFHKENLEAINKQEWEDIFEMFKNTYEYLSTPKRNDFTTFKTWLQEKYFAPEKKNT